MAAVIYTIIVVLEKLVWQTTIPGYATIVVLILLLGGMQLFCIGIIGEYIGKIYMEAKRRPRYIVEQYLKD